MNFKEALDRVIGKTSSENERRKFFSFFHDEGMEYEIKNTLFNKIDEYKEAPDDRVDYNAMFRRLWSKIETREKENSKTRQINRFKAWGAVAAVLLFGIVIGNLMKDVVSPQVPVYYTSLAPKGSISQIILPDSTLVCLNSGSEIKYSIDGEKGKREVFLSGEAWFQVNKNKKKEFVVHSKFFDVNVTGTEFNVKAYEEDEEVVVTLEEGAVDISSDILSLKENIALKPGEQLKFDKDDKHLELSKVNTSLYTSWRNNKLIFINQNLKELAILMERKYGIDIVIKDQNLMDYHFDGTIKDQTVFEMLDLISNTLSIKYKIIDQQVVIERK